jgi:tetratricopeptide (TPR) repeat protein
MRRCRQSCHVLFVLLPLACSSVTNGPTAQTPAGSEEHVKRGQEYVEKNEYDKAIREFTEAIRLDPTNADAYQQRGLVYDHKKEYDKAISDFTDAFRLEKVEADKGNHLNARGAAHEHKKDYAKAIADYTEAIQLDTNDDAAHDRLAWILATCPKDDVRDGKRAVELAKKACELKQWDDSDSLDTLAAAHAETGNFAEAVKWEKQALEKGHGFSEKKDKKGAEARLKLYEAGKPYRDE